MKKYILIFILASIFMTFLLIFTPVPIVSEDKAIVEVAVVTDIYEGGVKDVVFKTNKNLPRFYINRGLENGLDLQSLREKLLGQSVVFKYPKYWTPLDWNNTVRHVSKVEFNNEVIFNELK